MHREQRYFLGKLDSKEQSEARRFSFVHSVIHPFTHFTQKLLMKPLTPARPALWAQERGENKETSAGTAGRDRDKKEHTLC